MEKQLHAPGLHYARPDVRPQFRSTLGKDAEIDPQQIANAVRAVMNGILVTDRAIAQLESTKVSAADALLGRVEHCIDFAALDKAQAGVARLEELLGAEGTVVYEGSDQTVATLRDQVADIARAAAPYQKLRGRKP